mgnify:CR=1 FL=1
MIDKEIKRLYTIGPVEMFKESLEIGGKQLPYFRTDEFSKIVLSAASGLKRLLFNEDGEIIFLTASGTGAMEAVLMNCFSQNDNLIIIDGGSFGHRFTEICEVHQISYTAIKVEKDEMLTKSELEKCVNQGKFTGVLVNLDETSIGKLYDIQMISEVCRNNGLILVVDAISAFLADEVNMRKYGIDATIISSQKALSLAPGLSIVALSQRMLERVNNINSGTVYFDFRSHLENMKRGQTPFTPAVRILIELEEAVRRFENIGIGNIIKNTHDIALDFRRKIQDIGLKIPSYALSNAVTPVIFENGNALDVYQTLRNKYGYTVNPNGGEVGKYMFRVAHIGNCSIDDNDKLIDAISEIICEEKGAMDE